MNKKSTEKLENLALLLSLIVIIIFATFKDVANNEIIVKMFFTAVLAVFGATHLQKFVIHRNDKFAIQYRDLWIVFEAASFFIIPQSILLLFGVVYKPSCILEVICFAGDIIGMINPTKEKNEASNWASFSFTHQF